MKKRITWLALLMLLLSASCVLAATPKIIFKTSNLLPSKVGNEEYKATIDFSLSGFPVEMNGAKIVVTATPASPDAVAEGANKLEGVFSADIEDEIATVDATTDKSFTLNGKIWKVGSIPVTVTVSVVSTDDEDKETVVATESKKYTVASTAYAPSAVVLSQDEDLGEETTLMSLVQGEGYFGLNTKNAVDADVFKVTATLPVTFKASGLPSGLKVDISKITIGDAVLTAKDNTEAKSTAYGGKSADITFKLVGTPTQTKAGKISLTVTNAAGSKVSAQHDLLVFAPAAFATNANLSPVTWGKDYSVTLAATGSLPGYPVKIELVDSEDANVNTTQTLTTLGLSFDKNNYTIFGVVKSNDAAYGDSADVCGFWDSENGKNVKSKTFTLMFRAKSPGVRKEGEEEENGSLPAKKKAAKIDSYEENKLDFVRTFTLTVNAVAPEIQEKGKLQKNLDAIMKTLSISTETGTIEINGDDEFSFDIKAKGPGSFDWKVDGLPQGFKYEIISDADGDTPVYGNTVVIKLSQDEDAASADKIVRVLQNWPVTVTVKGAGGADSIRLQLNLSSPSNQLVISPDAGGLPVGVHNISHDVGSPDISNADAAAFEVETVTYKKKQYPAIAITALPGPITWKATNLPTGLVLSVDNSYPFGTRAYLLGSYTAASKKANQEYTITATNPVTKASVTVKNKVTVYAPPVITTKSLSALNIGKKYSGKIAVTGLETSVDVDIILPEQAQVGDYNPHKIEGSMFDDKEFVAGENDEDSTESLKFDSKKLTLTGTFDKYWDAERTRNLKVIITAKNPGYTLTEETEGSSAGMLVSKEIELALKPVAPAFKTTKLADYNGYGEDEDIDADGTKAGHSITITGTKPMDIKVYIASPDAKRLGISEGEEDIEFEIIPGEQSSKPKKKASLPSRKKATFPKNKKEESTTPVFTITSEDTAADTVVLKLGYAANQGWAFSALPLIVSVDNGSTLDKYGEPNGKGVSKIFKVAVKGYPPVLVSKDEDGNDVELSQDVTINVAAGDPISLTIGVSGDKPITLTSSQKFGEKKNEITVIEEDGSFKITGTAGTISKESKTVLTLTATNSQTKAKYSRKVTIFGQMVPEITTKDTAATKEIEVGKSLNLKLTAKGSKPILWKLGTEGEDDTASKDLLVMYGLSFDVKNGMFKGKALYPTSDDSGKKYEPKTFNVVAYNDAGESEPIVVTIGIKGKKPKLSSLKAITLMIASDDSKALIGTTELKSDIAATDLKSYVSWDLDGTPPSPFQDITVGNSADKEGFEATGRNIGYLDTSGIASPQSAKATTIKLKATNYGAVANGSVRVTVNDPRPDFLKSEGYFIGIQGEEKKDVKDTVTLGLQNYSWSSSATTLNWKISKKPAGKVSVAIKPASDQKSAVATITVKKGLSSKDIKNTDDPDDKIYHTTFAVTVTNKATNQASTAIVSVDVQAYDDETSTLDGNVDDSGTTALPAVKDALPEGEKLTEDEELPLGEGTVTYGDARTESSLTQAERAALSEGGYIIAAILPEITADESGLYDLEAVSLDEAAPEGGELVWFAFPRNAEGSEDDTIAEFYDEAGAEIFAVPEGRKVVPAPWLEKDVTYAPVIAVKAPVSGEAKDSLDEAETGDTVTEKAIEEAVNTPEVEE